MQGLPPPPWELTEGERLRKSNIFQGQLRLVEQLDGESKECGRWAARLRGLTGGNDDDAEWVVALRKRPSDNANMSDPLSLGAREAKNTGPTVRDWRQFWTDVEQSAFLPAHKQLRGTIDNLIDYIYGNFERGIHDKKKQAAYVIEMSGQACEARDAAQMEITAIEQANQKEREDFEEQITELNRLVKTGRKQKTL